MCVAITTRSVSEVRVETKSRSMLLLRSNIVAREKVAEGRMRGLKLLSPHPNPLPEERERHDAKSYFASGCDWLTQGRIDQ